MMSLPLAPPAMPSIGPPALARSCSSSARHRRPDRRLAVGREARFIDAVRTRRSVCPVKTHHAAAPPAGARTGPARFRLSPSSASAARDCWVRPARRARRSSRIWRASASAGTETSLTPRGGVSASRRRASPYFRVTKEDRVVVSSANDASLSSRQMLNSPPRRSRCAAPSSDTRTAASSRSRPSSSRFSSLLASASDSNRLSHSAGSARARLIAIVSQRQRVEPRVVMVSGSGRRTPRDTCRQASYRSPEPSAVLQSMLRRNVAPFTAPHHLQRSTRERQRLGAPDPGGGLAPAARRIGVGRAPLRDSPSDEGQLLIDRRQRQVRLVVAGAPRALPAPT